ncbi:hypothetical protein PC119_g363 [Phytophthora cactorum]|nr:hypothetical protein PC111_g153 [Phytophthora cactorum]KAG3041941.1 hypothetical protein PC119_g363 [Phytophthora cactorum]KAG3192724.1 hypothetical protein C6341_g495 [Phytophthora cactorum]
MAQYRATASSKESSNAGESDEASTCVICLESLEKSLAALPCGHVFHHICAKKAIAHHPACPVCRFQAGPRNVVRLYLSFGAEATHDDNSSCNAAVGTNRFKPTTVSSLPERLREMKSELGRAHQIQRMTSSHSFRLESDVVRLKQRLEQTTRRMQHIQSQLECAEAQLRIATTIYTQHNQSKRALTEFDRKVRTTAEWMLEKIRERQQFRCPNCASEWAEMKRITRELAAVGSGSRTCCQHHGRQRSMRTTGRAPPTSYSRALRQPRLAAQHAPLWMLLFAPPKPSSTCMKNSDNPDDIDMSTAWLEQVVDQPRPDAQAVALPSLQLATNRHRLAAIMNTEDIVTAAAAAAIVGRATAVGASKSSLAFILGGIADEDQTHSTSPSFADLAHASSASATENRAANVPTPAAAPKVKKSRICKFENCTRYVVNRGLCIGHGGGKRCAVVGCTSSAKNLGVCWKHGGSTKCTVTGCENRAKSRGVCWSHGGGRKCSEENCSKTAVSHGLCWAHGGGKRCVVEGCRKPAYERNGNVCSLHQATNAGASQKPAKR